MPGLPDRSEGAAVPSNGISPQQQQLAVSRVHHGLGHVSKVSISWGLGNKLRLSYLQQSPAFASSDASSGAVIPVPDGSGAGKVVEVRLGGSNTTDPEQESGKEAEKRRLAYESLPAFASLQSQRQMLLHPGEISGSLPSHWWEIVLEYSHSISAVLGPNKSYSGSASKHLLKARKETQGPTVLKAVWDLLEIFYVDKHALSWLPERLVDWLESYDRVLSRTEPMIYSKLAAFQLKLSNMRFPEDDREYWDGIASALAVGWLDVGVNFLRMHGSYQHDQLDDRKTENGLVEAVALLISTMPRLRENSTIDALGTAYNFKPEFSKAWEKWRSQVAKLNGSAFWSECTHRETLSGLKRLLQLLLGDIDTLVASTTHWMELLVSHFLFIRPFSMVSEGMLSLARKCVQLKPPSNNDQLLELILAIMGENTEVVLVECSQLFDPWMLTHMVELLSARSPHAQALLRKERDTLGGISLEELHRLIYAQLLSSHPCSWQLAPLYLASCPRQGLGLLENLLLMQPVSTQSRLALKVLDICRIYDLQTVAETIMRVMGVHHWKHGRKGAGITWLQRAHDDRRLSAVANQLLITVTGESSGQSDRLQQFEGLIDLLGPEVQGFGGLSFLHRYRDFKISLHNFQEARAKNTSNQKLILAGRQAANCLMQLMKQGVAPQQFWLPLMHDSVELLEFPAEVLLTVAETNTLLMKLQDLSLAKIRGDTDSGGKPNQALDRVRLALAWNLGRAMLKV